MLKGLKKVLKNNQGQSVIEYALIIALIAVVAIAAITALGSKITAVFQSITDALPN